jgi:hypothetical protein
MVVPFNLRAFYQLLWMSSTQKNLPHPSLWTRDDCPGHPRGQDTPNNTIQMGTLSCSRATHSSSPSQTLRITHLPWCRAGTTQEPDGNQMETGEKSPGIQLLTGKIDRAPHSAVSCSFRPGTPLLLCHFLADSHRFAAFHPLHHEAIVSPNPLRVRHVFCKRPERCVSDVGRVGFCPARVLLTFHLPLSHS